MFTWNDGDSLLPHLPTGSAALPVFYYVILNSPPGIWDPSSLVWTGILQFSTTCQFLAQPLRIPCQPEAHKGCFCCLEGKNLQLQPPKLETLSPLLQSKACRALLSSHVASPFTGSVIWVLLSQMSWSSWESLWVKEKYFWVEESIFSIFLLRLKIVNNFKKPTIQDEIFRYLKYIIKLFLHLPTEAWNNYFLSVSVIPNEWFWNTHLREMQEESFVQVE